MKKSKDLSGTILIDDEALGEVSREEAKERILKLFEEKGELDYGDIFEKLGIDLKLIVEICDELEKSKKIEAIR